MPLALAEHCEHSPMAMMGLANLAQPAVSLLDCLACRVQGVPRQGRHDADRHDITPVFAAAASSSRRLSAATSAA
jgi:hypothetical protein